MPSGGINFLIIQAKRLIFLIVSLCILSTLAQSLQAQIVGEVVIANRYANIRSGPGTKYVRLGRANRGERFSVTEIRPEWYQIMYRGRAGWVFGKLVRFEQKMPTQDEISRVSAEIQNLNNRIDKMLEKINAANTLLTEKYAPISQEKKGAAGRKSPLDKDKESMRVGGGRPVSMAWAFVPGGARLVSGHKLKGWGLLAGTVGCLAAGAFYNADYRDYMKQYRALTQDAQPEQFSDLHDKAQSRLRLANGFFYAAAGLYAVNILDYFFFLPRTGIALELKTTPQSGQKINLSMSCSF
ncbi:MAG TPA: SH3 domain-containing protein [archaeon]|nr:SH3 domain-containing protein [archaeon]